MNGYRNIIERLNLLPHPEGGYYRRNWQSQMQAAVKDASGKQVHPERSIGSSILYLLPSKEVCAWHKVACDEMWHFYHGSSLKLHLISRTGEHSEHVLGMNLEKSELPQFTIPRQTWFCAEVLEDETYSFCGCTLWPSFSYADFELAEHSKLLEDYPQHRELINRIFKRQNS
ncbi:MAG: cupin domain-containing protein [Candidatus Cloacimonetes bacterium]|nr:cupin domain-containing protein [Candidatus Cloacimonadota bacterium]MCB5269826.1 cupin domain-containing protein [Candidatus Cloacimonadota bacterium]MDD3097995.1 cupin domain-containing protein [Candidatus Cloacimonadota bacterium]MDD3578398.1 cupin domain-containing protein [Candidatus Cloacimonadota bacterium]MDD4033872.1 cupin domain-containing protein [Candidatus Cloacimonadota bacterium]